MRHRKPSRSRETFAKTTLPIAIAAAAAVILTAPANAAPGDTPSAPTTPNQPGVSPNDSQPGVSPAPAPPVPDNMMSQEPNQQQLVPAMPRIAPLPVPGVQPNPNPVVPQDDTRENELAQVPQQQQPTQPKQQSAPQQRYQPQTYYVPDNPSAPPAPVVTMQGRHVDAQANVDGGALAPGVVANTHHFGNDAGYVGTVGYRTPTGTGEAGISVDTTDPDHLKFSAYTGATATAPTHTAGEIDVTAPRAALSGAEQWIRQQPGGAAALDAMKLPPIIPDGGLKPQTTNVGGATVQWGGSLQV